jgi:hypothetical protein
MKRLILACSSLGLVLALAGALLAHPHFNKTISAKLPSGVDVTITYNTTPSNEMRAKEVKVGAFASPRRPTLKLSAEVKAGAVTIPAGDYTIGVVKNSDTDWTMALHPGQVPRGTEPDASKLIKLESMYSGSAGTADHMLIDLTPGKGKFEGKAVLTLHFGTMFLQGSLG